MTDKKTIIMQAAIRVISAYGFKRSSMDDIAREAGISRPAIYLVYKNKDDVFRSCVQFTVDQAFELAHIARDAESDPKARLTAYLIEFIGCFHRLLVIGPHGQEILEAKSRLLPNEDTGWSQRFAGDLNELLGQTPTAEDGIILACAASGVKNETKDEALLKARLTLLADRFHQD